MVSIESFKGKVYLVGAGPGDPGLITLRGKACIQRADVIIYDYLASPELLKWAHPEAELIYAGKMGGAHILSQDQINTLIIAKASQGHVVTRLKGGDPFIFGRGGEEAEALAAAGISFEIVPGVTSVIAAPAYAGIPLTHRQLTSVVTFVTGHEDPHKSESRINWPALAQSQGTLVFLMGVKNLPQITQKLIKHGMSTDTPVALVRWGTTPRQVTVEGSLANITERVQTAGLKAPAIIIIGAVVRLREILGWYEKRPLFGKRVIVTRARQQAGDLVRRLSELGAECLEVPTIRIVPPDDWRPLDQAITRIGNYDWLIFTSVNGVDHFFKRMAAGGKDARALSRIQTAGIGPATAQRLLAFGLKTDVLPKNYHAESVVEAFADMDIRGAKILLPRAEKARPVLPRELTRMGATVEQITVYRTLPLPEQRKPLIQALESGSVDLITFTSSSTVRNFKDLLPADRFDRLLNRVTIASIGPITSATAKELGFNVHIAAQAYTIPGLCKAILRHYSSAA